MKLKICEYCGTEYQQDLQQCPLCGRSLAENGEVHSRSRAAGKRGGARVAPKGTKKPSKRGDRDRIPQWMWAVICVILGLAVLIGLAYFLISMGYIGGKEAAQVPQTSVVVPEVDPVNEPELLEPMPEVVEPADLSCKELSLSQNGIVFDVKGSSVFLTAVPTPLDSTDPITFVSADETVATVNSSGMITAVGRGQTEITVLCGDVSESCIIVCDFPEEEETTEPEEETKPEEQPETEPEEKEPDEEEPEEVPQPELSSVDFTLFRPGEETTLSVKNVPEGAAVTYVSSNPDVVTVSSTGKVKAVGNGMATITVTVGDTKLTCIARCNLGTTAENTEGSETTVTGTLSLSYTDVSLFSVGESFTISLRDSDGNKATGVSWTTSNGGICSVDANGRVTGLGGGTATITASYKGQTYSCIVRCNF